MTSPAPVLNHETQFHAPAAFISHADFKAAFLDAIARGDESAQEDLIYHYKLAGAGMIRFANDAESIAVCKQGRAGAIKFVHAVENTSNSGEWRRDKIAAQVSKVPSLVPINSTEKTI